METIPDDVIMVVSDVLAGVDTRTNLTTLFAEAGAPTDAWRSNKVETCRAWFQACNESPKVRPFEVLGAVLVRVMDDDRGFFVEERRRIDKVLAKHGLAYREEGRIVGATTATPTQTLDDHLRGRDFAAIEDEFKRCTARCKDDPPTATTAACAVIEALCRVYIEDEGLTMPRDRSIKPLWSVVSNHLGLHAGAEASADLRRILGGLASVMHGVGDLRTHAGSAHGRGRTASRIEGRHARLAVHAAHTLVSFVIETWDARNSHHGT